jgi:hypothetical protein
LRPWELGWREFELERRLGAGEGELVSERQR